MSCIVLTTDLSTESQRAFAPAAELAKKLGLAVQLLHVVEDVQVSPHGAPLAPPQSSPDLQEREDEARKKLAEVAAGLGGAEVTVRSGADVVATICEFAREQGAEYLALSTHGRTGIRHLVLGSVAGEVVRKSTVPVITYPQS